MIVIILKNINVLIYSNILYKLSETKNILKIYDKYNYSAFSKKSKKNFPTFAM